MQATVGLLAGRYRLSRNEVRQAVKDLFGVSVSVGTVQNTCERVGDAIATPVARVLDAVRNAPAVHCDETGWRHGGGRAWLWTAVTDFAAAFQIDPKRSRAAFHRLLGEDFEGLLASDRWRPYESIPPERRQLCHAHLRRDMQALIDRGGEAAIVGKALLAQNDAMFSLCHAFGRGELDRAALLEAMIPVQERTRTLLEGGLTHTDRKVKALSKDLLRLWPSLWVFVANDGVAPTNNVAERTLRPAVLLRKCNGGTRSEAGANFTERMLTASATASRQEIGLFGWLCEAMEATVSYTSPPGLLQMAAVNSG